MVTRESLLEVTARLYSEHGWRGTTTRRIAEAAGINEVTVFRQFGSKESLLLEAIQHASGGKSVAHLPECPDRLLEELTLWSLAQHQSIAAKGGMIRSCLAEGGERPALGPKACEPGMAAFSDAVRYLGVARKLGLIDAKGSIQAAAVMLINTIFLDAITRDFMPVGQTRPAEESIAQFVELVLRGLGAKDAG